MLRVDELFNPLWGPVSTEIIQHKNLPPWDAKKTMQNDFLLADLND